MPSNDGKDAPGHIDRLIYTKVFDLELSNMEGTPVYSLKHQLSIGSEIGNIIISDPSLSPRHATFILQQEVVSVIDHGSVSGTRVNGTKIPAGKYIILEESDIVNVGDLEVRLKVGSEATAHEEVPEVPTADSEEAEEEILEESEEPEETEEEGEEDVWDEAPAKKKFNFAALFKKKTRTPEPKKIPKATKGFKIEEPKRSANSLVRVVAVISDILLSYSLLVILLPFDEVREFLDFIPSFLTSLIDVDWKGIWEAVNADYGFLGQMLEDLFQFFSSTFHFGPLIIMFVLTRLLSTLLLGVSFSEFMLGVQGEGNRIWARIGGAFRVLVGVVTGPLIIFDLSAIISRRTFKEVLTFTRTSLSSKFVAILGTILFLPIMIAFALVSPLLQGFEPPEPLIVNDRVDQRMKVRPAPGAEGATEAALVKDKSTYLHLELDYNPNEVSIFPDFKFQGLKSKLNLKTELVFFEKEIERSAVLEVYKNFDMKQLLGIGMKGNLFLYDKYPQIYNFVYSSEESNPSFKASNDIKSQLAFGNEFIQFTKTAFGLSADNAIEVMEGETPLLKGLVDYKASFLSLLEYKDFDQIGFIKLGNILFMKVSYIKQRPFDLLIPLLKGEGKIYKVSFDRKENLGDLTSKLYKFNFEKADWLPDPAKLNTEIMTSFQVLDLFSTRDMRKTPFTPDSAQSMYAFYFETSSAVLSRGNAAETDIWKACLQNMRKLLEALPGKVPVEGEEDPKSKLEQNFRDLSDALENKNYEYFGLNQTTNI